MLTPYLFMYLYIQQIYIAINTNDSFTHLNMWMNHLSGNKNEANYSKLDERVYHSQNRLNN